MLVSAGGFFKWVDDQGVVHYSDKPRQGAQEIKLPKAPASPPPTRRAGTPSQNDDGDKGVVGGNYSAFSIAQPDNNETIRSNEGLINISFFIEPGLQSGHKIRVFVDGRRLKDELTSTSFSLKGIRRGTHSMRAEIIDETGEPMASTSSVTFHLRKESILDKAKPVPPIEPPGPGDGGGDSGFKPDYKPGPSPGFKPGPKPNYQPNFRPNYKP